MEQLAHRVRELIVASDHYRQAMAAGMGIGVSESAVLGHLLHNGPQTPTLIAARIGLTPASTTALLDRLSAVQLVVRSPNPRDRRSVLVSLTDLGEDTVRAMYAMFALDIDAALEQADPRLRDEPELRHAVTELLDRMAAALRERAGDRAGVEAVLRGDDPDRTGSPTAAPP